MINMQVPGGSAATIVQAGTQAARPAAGTAGTLYFATDTKILYRDSGSAWVVVALNGLASSVRLVSGTLTLHVTAAWVEASSSLRLTVPAQVGDLIEYGVNFWGIGGTSSQAIDCASLDVSNAIVNRFGGGGSGVDGWYLPASTNVQRTGSAYKTIVSGDLVSGIATITLVTFDTSAGGTGAQILATATDPCFVYLKNHGQ